MPVTQPTINFIAGLAGSQINNIGGSGLGFYGTGGFGTSVNVGAWQGRTFITDSTGSIQGFEVNNVTYLNSGSGILGQAGSGTPLKNIPNYQATLQVQFLNPTAVKTQNQYFMIYDRINIANAASGVHTNVANIIHPNQNQTTVGSGDGTWTTFSQATPGQILAMPSSPGTSGFSPNGPLTTDVEHDWYLAISASPDSIGSKSMYAGYFYTEYL